MAGNDRMPGRLAHDDGAAVHPGTAPEGISPPRGKASRPRVVNSSIEILRSIPGGLDDDHAFGRGVLDRQKIVGPPFDRNKTHLRVSAGVIGPGAMLLEQHHISGS